jgi:radical SAM protein with 4Fe4S-binding SPASM domain
MGEPLAHPQFPEFLELLEKQEIPLILTSNGILVDRYQQELNNSRVIKQINFSVHSYLDNYPSKDITSYLTKLTEFSKGFIENHPEAFINFRLWDVGATGPQQGAHHDIIFERLRLLFSDPELPEAINVRSRKSYRLDRHIKLHFDSRFEWPTLSSPTQYGDGFCYGLKNQLAILTEGTVVPCCLDKEAVINLGSIFETPLKEILESERARAIRVGFAKHQAVEELCQKCQYKTRFTTNEKSERSDI